MYLQRREDGRRIFTLILTSFLIMLSFSFQASSAGKFIGFDTSPIEQGSPVDFRRIVSNINISLIQSHVKYLSSLGSRIPGYPGNRLAAEYIKEKFEEYGLRDVHFESFNVTVPVDYGAKITVLEPEIREIVAYPLLPNHVNPSCTPPDGIEGPLIWGGSGRIEEFDGKEVEGSIVLMDFDTRWYWRNVMLLGGKAVIFIEPELPTLRTDALMKQLQIPISMPRLWVSREDGLYLKKLALSGKRVIVNVKSQMRWENVETWNVVGLIPGTEPELENDGMIISAYYDSYSIVPSLAPGATEALGIASLLELARYMAANPPRRPVLFVAFSGHSFALAGGREFVWKHFDEVGLKYKVLFQMAFSTESEDIAVSYWGDFYKLHLAMPGFDLRFKWLSVTIFKKILTYYEPATGRALIRGINREFRIYDSYYVATTTAEPGSMVFGGVMEPPRYPLVFEAEAFSLAGGLSVVIRTTNCLLAQVFTPHDKFELLNFEKLIPQVECTFCILYAFSMEDILSPGLALYPTTMAPGYGFASLTISVIKYNITTGWYEPVPYALVYLSTPMTHLVQSPNIVLLTDDKGEVVFRGIRPSAPPAANQPFVQLQYHVSGFVINYTTGAVEWADEYGGYGPPRPYLFISTIYRPDTQVWVRVFKVSSISLHGLVDPRSAEEFTAAGFSFQVLNFLTHTPLVSPLSIGPLMADRMDAILFLPSETPLEILFSLKGSLVGILANITRENPEGKGYVLRSGEHLRLYNTPFHIVSNLYFLVEGRLDKARKFHAYSPRAELYLELATKDFRDALDAFKNKSYSMAYAKISSAWSHLITAYGSTVSFYFDIMNTTVFIFLIILPCAILLERLLVNTIGIKRLMATLLIYSACALSVALIHPGFHLVTNIYVIVVAFTIVAIAIPVLGIIFGVFASFLGELKKKILGLHFAEISRMSAAALAFSLGVQNMRRRKFRSALTIISISVITFSLVAFTSVAWTTAVRTTHKPAQTLYNGLLIKHPLAVGGIFRSLPEMTYDYLRSSYADKFIICARAWLHPPQQQLRISPVVVVQGFLGLEAEEDEITGISRALIAEPRNRWFVQGEYYSCIIPQYMSAALGKKIGDVINVWGLNLTIVGIFDDKLLMTIVDLDQLPITPIDYSASSGGQIEVRLQATNVVIIPLKLALDLGGSIVNIAMVPRGGDIQQIVTFARTIAIQMNVFIIVGLGGVVAYYYSIPAFAFAGFETILIPLAIGGFTILNVMLGSLYERTKDISIYSVVGLSPLHVGSMFLAEIVLVAIISATIGYLSGIICVWVIDVLGLRPEGFYPSFVSAYVLLSISVSLATVIASAMYPVRKAASTVTPSVERGWRPPTKPVGDKWIIPMPFSVTTDEEVNGIMAFIYEYLDIHKTERAGVFMTRGVSFKRTGLLAKSIESIVQLAPWDAGLVQVFRVTAEYMPSENRFIFSVYLERLEGYRYAWETANYLLLDDLRQQMLIWKALTPQEKMQYIEEGKKLAFIEEKNIQFGGEKR
ncbi:MAG: FtsX-like permease family protein [Candidatus Bathyarchaeia archaeon]